MIPRLRDSENANKNHCWTHLPLSGTQFTSKPRKMVKTKNIRTSSVGTGEGEIFLWLLVWCHTSTFHIPLSTHLHPSLIQHLLITSIHCHVLFSPSPHKPTPNLVSDFFPPKFFLDFSHFFWSLDMGGQTPIAGARGRGGRKRGRPRTRVGATDIPGHAQVTFPTSSPPSPSHPLPSSHSYLCSHLTAPSFPAHFTLCTHTSNTFLRGFF